MISRSTLALALLLSGCRWNGGPLQDEPTGPPTSSGGFSSENIEDDWPPSQVFIRIKTQRGQCPFVLERARKGRTFDFARLVLYGDVKHGMPITRLGALPAESGIFQLWPGSKPHMASDHIEVEIPFVGGPWRGVVAELCDGIRYPAVAFDPVPGQPSPIPEVLTEILHCSTPNVLTCIPWHQAVVLELVSCEDRAGNPVSREWCTAYAPYTWWRIREE